ncbi:MAG: hypothetical protein JXR69_00420 [Candidatus Delongbacteria bacterium]|nr:hypothetical protein [Candidatus Delongbacteria bacterium]
MLKKLSLITVLLFSLLIVFIGCDSDTTNPSGSGEPFLVLTSPNGGDVLQVSVSYMITWNDNISGNINIEVHQGVGNVVQTYTEVPSNGEYQITIPIDATLASDYKIKLISVQDSSLYDTSDDFFEISDYVSDGNDDPTTATQLTIPHTGDYAIYGSNDVDWYRVYLYSGITYYFRNTSAEDFDSEFFLYKGNAAGTDLGISAVVQVDDGDTSLQPNFEYTPDETSYYYLRVAYYSNNPAKAKQYDTGYYTLSISNSDIYGNLLVTSPDGGEVWLMGSGHNIIWSDDNINTGNVDIDLYIDGMFEMVIANGVANNGNYYWSIPSTLDPGSEYQIRIINSDDQGINDYSDYPFCISQNVYANVIGEWYFFPYGKQEDEYTVIFNSDHSLIYRVTDNGSDSDYPGTWSLTGNGVRFDISTDGFYPYCIGIVVDDIMTGTWYEGGDVGYWYGSRYQVK